MIVDLFVAKAAGGQGPSAIRHLRGLVSDIDVQVELLRNSKVRRALWELPGRKLISRAERSAG